jgi:VWFA-related protein
MSSNAGRIFVLLTILGTLLSFQAFLRAGELESQEKTKVKQSQEPLHYEISVTLKLIQVFVADPKGNPAPGLEKSDFVLFDNGKAQKITDFEKHFLQTPEAVAAEHAVSEAAPAAAALLKRKYILLFDNDSNNLEGINKSRKAALEFLDNNVQPGDEVAFFSCSPTSGLTVHEYFTSDHRKIRDAMGKIRSLPGESLGGLAVESFSEHELANPEHPTLDGMFSLFKDFESWGGGRRAYVRRDFIIGLTGLAKALQQVDGQKNIILFSREFRHILDSPSSPDAARFRGMAKELASANCPVFVVNTAGGMEKTLSANAGLSYLSNITGGRYYDDVDHYAENAMSIRNATSNYYVLGYSIDATWDGKFHDIKVEVTREGYKTFGQKGYFNPVRFNKLSAMEKSLHLIDVALGEDPYFGQPGEFPLTALPFSDKTGDNTILISMIPVKTMLDGVGQKTEVISLILAADKSIVGGRRAEIDWSTLAAENLCQYSAAALAPGRYDARVIVRNLETGRSAVGACAVEVPQATAAPLKLFPPLIVGPYRSTQYVNFSGSATDKGDQAFSLSQAFLFPNRQYSPRPGELEEGSESFRAVLRCQRSGPDETQDFRVRAWLEIPGDGQKTPLEVVLLDSAKRGEILFLILEFRAPAGLPAGSYVLYIEAEDPETKARSGTKLDLLVKQEPMGTFLPTRNVPNNQSQVLSGETCLTLSKSASLCKR